MADDLPATLEEALGRLSWYQRRYHEMIANAAFQERTIGILHARIEFLERRTRSPEPEKS